MADYLVTGAELTAVADAIRLKGGTSAPLEWTSGYIAAIQAISGGDNPFALTDYIESNGTQWINTGYLCGDDTKIELVASVNVSNVQYASLFGARNGNYNTATKAFVIYRDGAYLTVFVGGGVNKATVATAPYFGNKARYTLSKNSFSVESADGIYFYGVGFTGGAVDDVNAVYLLNFNQAGADPGASTHCSAKLYRCRIYEGNVLVHEFVPWQDNGVACLKDTVSGTLKYNAGSGSFTYGQDV